MYKRFINNCIQCKDMEQILCVQSNKVKNMLATFAPTGIINPIAVKQDIHCTSKSPEAGCKNV